MGITFNPFTGTLDFTGTGGGGGTIGGSIADTQVAFGTGVNTIGGSANLTWINSTQTINIGDSDPNAVWGGLEYTASIGHDLTAAGTMDYTILAIMPIINQNGMNVWALNFVPEFTGSAATDVLIGFASYPQLTGTGPVNTLYGFDVEPAVHAGTTVTDIYALQLAPETHVGATIGSIYGARATSHILLGGTITTQYSYWSSLSNSPFGHLPTNAYHFWADDDGVFRIRADNTFNGVYQAIPALYNPQFTKYTPGAANFERIVLQWESNVGVITTEKGGTGTLRALQLGDASVPVQVGGSVFRPTTSDAAALGSATLQWSDLFLAEGGVINWDNGDATLTQVGDVVTLAGAALANSAPGTAANSVATIDGTQTLTNKRITKRVVTAADATSITPNTDSADVTYQANTQAAGTLTINADGGTPTNGQSWLLKIKSTNVQTFAWNAVYVGGTVALPTTTTGSSTIDYFAFLYDTVNSKWQFTGAATGY